MNLFATFRQRRQAVPLLSTVVVAFLGLVLMPCAMAATFDLPAADAALAVPPAEHCRHSSLAEPINQVDCCCDLDAASGVAKLELPKINPQLVFAVDQYLITPLVVEQLRVDLDAASLSGTSPPVYLRTQRLRL